MPDPLVPNAGDVTLPPRARRRRRLSPAKRALFAAVTLGALLGGAEVACRLRAWWRDRDHVPIAPFETDAYRGVVLAPGVTHEKDGRVATINALGMRSLEVTADKAPGVRRILCVGASSTYGLFIGRDDRTWPARLEERLRGEGHAVEVLNAGTPSWDVRASQTNLELGLYDLRPDIVVVCHGYNDAIANLDPGYQADSHVEDVDALWRPRRYSALYAALLRKLQPVDALLQRKAPRFERPGLLAFERNLRRMVRRSRAQGASVVLCTEAMACRETLAGSLRDGVPQVEVWFGRSSPFPYEVLVAAMRAYYDVVRAVAREEGAVLVDLEALMPDDVALFASPIHHTEAGEVVVADLVADGLLRAGLVPTCEQVALSALDGR